ncbi:hypothetical protein [Variovorax sp. OV329]|uniref:hypothetical protein n=1 Tax=Variovorax sp. OV329 TaxID=1882825 RepID=UPI0008E4A750|nr:hypothetical protein [Variovorax sp. OV329]SFL87272.1 hypothetical protein SAMN05444747_10166 [Variovorax sp. OV329]
MSKSNPIGYDQLTVDAQCALLESHHRELDCRVDAEGLRSDIASGIAVMLATKHAIAVVTQAPAPLGIGGKNIKWHGLYLYVRPGHRGHGEGAGMIGLMRERFPGHIWIQCKGEQRAAYFERLGFIRPLFSQDGYFYMSTYPGQNNHVSPAIKALLTRA